MKIALFHNLPSGGAKRTVYEQATGLSRNHTIDLFTLSTADAHFLEPVGCIGKKIVLNFQPGRLYKSPFGRVNMAVRTLDLARLEKVMQELAAEINRGGYDLALVHPCQVSFSPAILNYLAIPSLYYRHDVVRWLHDPPIQRPYARKGFRNRLDRFDPLLRLYRNRLIANDYRSMLSASQTITNSCFIRESLLRLYDVAPRVCYQGVDETLFRPLGLEREDFILSVGMISPYKGFDFIIHSLALINKGNRPRLVITGNHTDGDELRYLQTLAEERDVQVVFLENVPLDDLICLYNTARFVAYTPVMESFGLVPLEAMACGTPVLGVREGGLRETIIDGQTGLLVERDPNEFADAILWLLQSDVCQRLGSQARAWVLERWTASAAIRRLEAEITRTINLPADRDQFRAKDNKETNKT